ncbi:MAG: hybrid sensor histidine kinase/response regulator [Elainella sp. Prado103]|jgi:signal transduction histidine kinase|nr:hybrid sensor histidine kinase/response regulator [Elainella sp. Prado103]
MVSDSNHIENAELDQYTKEQLLKELNLLRQYVAELEHQLGYSARRTSTHLRTVRSDQVLHPQAESDLLLYSKQATDLAETAYRIKNEFLAVLSHELRSPLNPILGWTQMLRSHHLSPEMTSRALEAIERNAKLQVQLIEDLLDVSQILQGKLKLNVDLVNLNAVIEAAIATVHYAAENKAIDLKFISEPIAEPPQPIKIMGDPDRLQQIAWNLLSNAVKFTPSGGQITVRLTTQAPDVNPYSGAVIQPHAMLQVADTGQGIDPAFLPHIFEYFRQGDSTITRQFGGLGLGLTIVRHLVELHGGRIEAESRGENQGATFRVWLPLLVPTEPQTDRQRRDFPLTPDLTNVLQHCRVLVVDHNTDMREYLEFVLAQANATVAIASSAGEVLTKLPRFKPDVLVSAINLPGVDGCRLLRQIRSLVPELGGTVPAIALTDYPGEYDQQQIIAAGFQHHFPKPIHPLTLVTTIAQLISPPTGDGSSKAANEDS